MGQWKQATLRSAWAGWCEGVATRQAKQQQMAATVQAWQRARLRAAWAAWAVHRAFRLRARAVLAHFTQQVVTKAFASWREHTALKSQLASKLAAAVQRWQNSTLASAFEGGWRGLRDLSVDSSGQKH